VTSTTNRLLTACITAALALGLAACGGAATPPASTAPASSAAAAEPTDSADDSATADDDEADTAAAGAKVSANTASEDEIAAALETAGVSNAGRWAEEVVEYRPYPPDDANLTKLRENLAKYNPGQETTDKIVSALTP
jgi:Flp pilus assembly protein TadD